MTKDTGQKNGRRKEHHWFGPWLNTQSRARETGSKHYYTGVPCKNSHIALRLTSNAMCMECHRLQCNEFNKMKRQLDSEWREEQNRLKRENYDPLRNAEWCKNWRENNKEYVRETGRIYMQKRRAEDPTLNEMSRELIAIKREDKAYVLGERAKERQRYAENPEKFREKTRLYFKENPEVAATQARNRRARVRAADGFHTKDDIAALLKKQGYKCASCGASIADSYDVDHIIALSNGGSNWPANLQCLCQSCNRQKGSLDPIEFAQRKGRLL